MADLQLSQPERRSLLLPILLALAVLVVAGYLVYRLTPHSIAEVTVPRIALYPAHIVFSSDTRVVGAEQAEDHLYLLVTVRITDKLRLPLFLKDFTATLKEADGASEPPTSAVEQRDLANLFVSFPALKKLAEAQPVPPLLRETRIEPGASVEGYVILHFPITPAVWQSRQDANLTVALYHQPALSVSLPRSADLPLPPPPAASPRASAPRHPAR